MKFPTLAGRSQATGEARPCFPGRGRPSGGRVRCSPLVRPGTTKTNQPAGACPARNNRKETTTMPIAVEACMEHIGETKALANHDRDMIHELSKRIDAVWHLDQYIANAEKDKELKQFWSELKAEEQDNVKRLKKIMARHIEKNCF
jgi:hypothetical protein